jgi:class 3 adenylate cyclase/peptidoglycan hydrolase-like protein with peptidoglycan-binding domain
LLSEERIERRLAAILAADVAGYSRLMGENEAGTLARLRTHRRELIDPKIGEHNGRIVKTTGDGLLIEFPSVVEAVACAVAVQRGMEARNATVPDAQRIEFRIGINLGDVIVEGGDIHGDGVNVAARLEGLAAPGAVYVSRTVRDHVGERLDIAFDDLGEQRVKNIAQALHIYCVRGEEPSAERSSVAILPFRSARVTRPASSPEDAPAPFLSWRGLVLAAAVGAIIGGAATAGIMLLLRPAPPPNVLALVTAKQEAEMQVQALKAELSRLQNKATSESGLDDVQRALRLLGHLQSESEGGFGPGTIAAIKQFQLFQGVPGSGTLSEDQFKELMDMSRRLTALLDQLPVSPQGVGAPAVKGAAARYALGWKYEIGDGVKPDLVEAAYWYTLAAADGEPRAFTNLGTLTARGYGANKPDPKAAALLWWAAAARSEAVAMYDLGALNERGIGVATNIGLAKAWYERAAALNDPDARAALKRLGG